MGYICILFEENPLNNYFYHIDEHYALPLDELLAYLKFDLENQILATFEISQLDPLWLHYHARCEYASWHADSFLPR